MANKSYSKLLGLFRSRKFWASLIGTVIVVLNDVVPGFPFDADQVTNIIYILAAYILGTAIDDAGYGIGGSKRK
jgi:hypothetical protein